MKITKVLDDNKYEIVVDQINTNTNPTVIGVAHDYVLFSSWTYIFTESPLMLRSPGGGSCNMLPIKSRIQVPIRIMGEVVMPYLNNHPYLKEEHFSKYDVYQKEAPVITWSDDIHVYDKEKKKFVSIPKSIYYQLTNKTD